MATQSLRVASQRAREKAAPFLWLIPACASGQSRQPQWARAECSVDLTCCGLRAPCPGLGRFYRVIPAGGQSQDIADLEYPQGSGNGVDDEPQGWRNRPSFASSLLVFFRLDFLFYVFKHTPLRSIFSRMHTRGASQAYQKRTHNRSPGSNVLAHSHVFPPFVFTHRTLPSARVFIISRAPIQLTAFRFLDAPASLR